MDIGAFSFVCSYQTSRSLCLTLAACEATAATNGRLLFKAAIHADGMDVHSQAINISHMLMPLKPAAKLPKYRRNEYGEVLTSEHQNLGMVYNSR